MELKDAIASRRAHRAFTNRRVDEPTIRELLAAGVQAPSAVNEQPWSFAVVQNAETLHRWSETAKRLLLEERGALPKLAEFLHIDSFNIFYDATTLVVIAVEHPNEFSAADCWLAAQNLMLTATELGLGTCCIGFAIPALNTPDALRELGLGPAARVYVPIIVGYPRAVLEPVARRAPHVTAWLR